MNCVKSIGCYSFSKPRPRRVRKTASAYFCRGLGCPQQAKQERRQAGGGSKYPKGYFDPLLANVIGTFL